MIESIDQNNTSKTFFIRLPTGITFDDIVGLEDVKKELKRALYPLKYPEAAAYYKINSSYLVLFFGPPGTGKTLAVEAIATELDADLICVIPSDIYSSILGETERNIAALFSQVNKSDRPTILHFENGDIFFNAPTQNEGYARFFLNEWKSMLNDLLQTRKNTVVTIFCDDPEDIDIALCCKCNDLFYFPLPNEAERKMLFEKELSGVLLDEDVDVAALAKKTPRYSGRNIYNICDDAKKDRNLKVVEAEERGDTNVKEGVCQEDLLDALKKVKPDVSEADIRRYEDIAKKIAKG